jgi:hypothetical protein
MASRKLSINLLSQNSAGAEHIPNVVCHLNERNFEHRRKETNLDCII